MSQPPTHNDDSINANVVTFVIMTCFVLVSILLLSQLPPAGGGNNVALAAATVEPPTVVPSVTPLPPTLTPPPTETPTVIPTAAPTEPPPTATDAPTADTATTGAVNTAANYDPALIERGQQQFMLCAACHGPDGHGIPNLGKDLIASDFVHSQTDEELLTFIKTGRPIWDPLNTTGIDMPPKGGNPAMTDDDILAVIAYIRSLTASG